MRVTTTSSKDFIIDPVGRIDSPEGWIRGGFGLRTIQAALLALAVLLSFAALPAGVRAAAPELLWSTQGTTGGANPGDAGRLATPTGVAASPINGHVYVVEAGNSRISEFDAWGQFVKTWGWGVVASGPGNQPAANEIQKLTVSATAGSFKLTYTNSTNNVQSATQTTGLIAFNAPASTVETALETLESIAPGDVSVTGGPGDASGSTPYTIEFRGSLADTNLFGIEVVESTLVGDAVVDIMQDGGSFEVCVPGQGDTCQAGQKGGHLAGQISNPRGMAIDAAGSIYVAEVPSGGTPNMRIQKFDSAGHFLLMFGGEVNKTKSAEAGSSEAERNLCTASQLESGDVCGGGIPGTGKGQFASDIEAQRLIASRIAIGPAGTVFVGDVGRIQEFEPSGVFKSEVKIPIELMVSMAMDGVGNFYVSQPAGSEVNYRADFFKLSPTGTLLHTYPIESLGDTMGPITVDSIGNVFIVDESSNSLKREILEFAPSGSAILPEGSGLLRNEGLIGFNPAAFWLTGLGTSTACDLPADDLYVSNVSSSKGWLSAYGPPPDPDVCPPPKNPPTISDSYAVAVDADGAMVRAEINPHFWTDTAYYVEYGTGKCSEGGCEATQPAPPGNRLGDKVIDAPIISSGVFLADLEPATTYHYRFVAKSSGGGPVIGPEGNFTTFEPASAPNIACPNQAFRVGPSANLPDCRAFEMVSPLDKNNGDVAALINLIEVPAALNQSAANGEKITYASYRSFGNAQSAPYTSQYVAERGANDWSNQNISPSRSAQNILGLGGSLDTEFRAFSEDLCSGWLVHDADPTLAPGAVEGFANLYRADECGGGGYEALSTTEPPKQIPLVFSPDLQGVSADGAHVIFRVDDKLTDEASSGTNYQLYEFTGGQLRLVSVLPNEAACTLDASAGSANSGQAFRTASVDHAISADGSRIYWSCGSKLYERTDGATTLVGTGQYWTAAADGSKAIFTNGAGVLSEFDLANEEVTTIAPEVAGVLGASDDVSRIYFVSKAALAPGATKGKANLYLGQEGAFGLIAVLSDRDAFPPTDEIPSPISRQPISHTARVSPDGLHAAFMSAASLSGYDNTDAKSGEADAEVFVYDATAGGGEGRLSCASCNRTGARPTGANINGDNALWVAAQIPTWQTQLYASRVLSDDGSRLFFESFEALVPQDTNGRLDVYQWEAPGSGSCTSESPAFSQANDGCVSLISSGESPGDSKFVDADPNGENVFFTTSSSLLPQDSGLIDLYDARIGGGYPPPPAKAAACEGEACQGPVEPPNDPTPGSSSYSGPGNPKQQEKVRQKKAKKAKQKKRRHHSKRTHSKKAGDRSQQRTNRNRGVGR